MGRYLIVGIALCVAQTAFAQAPTPQDDPQAPESADGAEASETVVDDGAQEESDGEQETSSAESSNESSAESSDESAEALPAAEIGRRLEETFQQMQELTPLLRKQTNTLAVQRAIPNFVESVTRLSDDHALERLQSLHSASLHDLEHEWGRVRTRLTDWQDALEVRTIALTEAREQVVEAQTLWQATREAQVSDDESAAETQLARIDSLLHRIEVVLRRIDRRLEEVLTLQGELSDQGILIARQISRIAAAQQNVRERRQRRDHRPLWRGWSPLGDEEEDERTSSEVVADEHWASVQAFLYTEKKPMMWHGGILFFVALFFLWMRVRGKSRLERRRPSAQRTLRKHPIAAALLLLHVTAPLIYSYVPVIVVGTSLALMVPVLHLLNVQMLRAGHRPILALLVLAALSVPLSLGFAPEWSRRYYVLALQLAALYFVGQLYSKKLRATIVAESAQRRRLHGLVRVSVIPLVFATYLLFAGYTQRAELWTTGTLWVIGHGIAIFLALEFLASLLRIALRQPAARALYMVRDHRRQVAHYLIRFLTWGAVVYFVVLALTSFDLLDPTLESSRSAFRRTFEFGSIELSFGNVLAFLVMLIGTFVVMRLVHVLLEYEILPRFELDQGISSAISLSASYLLVAIGVVLAFGVAGVGPERLALLGGALGVGIGFGLQNVVSNFVSGLILVAERPIKVGDVIEVGGNLVGTVQRIGIRSSTVLSLNGAEVIVPNADLVSGQLINWTLSDARRRLELVVGASYSHDPKEVIRILQRVVRRQANLLNDPPVEITCSSFADSAIEYTVRAWTQGYLEAIEAKSELATAIYSEFAECGIEIPFPQQDLHIKSVDAPLTGE